MLKLTFVRERETKGTVRYKEKQEDESQRPIVGTLYVTKPALNDLGNPQELQVTIEAGS